MLALRVRRVREHVEGRVLDTEVEQRQRRRPILARDVYRLFQRVCQQSQF